MLQTELYDHDVNGDPVPNVASDADIAVAERLRRQLEERYLMRSPAPPDFASSTGRARSPSLCASAIDASVKTRSLR